MEEQWRTVARLRVQQSFTDTPQGNDRPILMWVGIREDKIRCKGKTASEAQVRMRDGLSVFRGGVKLVAVRADGKLSYGYVVGEFLQPAIIDWNLSTSEFPIQQAKEILSKLGISGPVEMRVQAADVVVAVQ